MAQSDRPHLVAPRAATLEAVRSVQGSWDIDAFHVMEERDNALIEQEILHGVGSSKFVYRFDMDGTEVSGISVIGARHLAAHYGGIKHRIVASVQKTGSLFTFTTYPAEGVPMQVTTAILPDLEQEDDFYGVIAEISDIKTGNTIQVERREARFGYRRDRSRYERPNFPTLAQSKAYRNGVLALIAQDVQLRWKTEMLKLKKDDVITDSVIAAKRDGVLRFAAAQGLLIDRRAIDDLTMAQISGLGDAAREENKAAFVTAARGMGLELAPEGAGEATHAAATTGNQTDKTPAPSKQKRQTTAKEPAAGEPASPPPPPSPPASPPPPPPAAATQPTIKDLYE